ncbi:MAG: DUF4832 domain-containing protein [Lachnospiraceae bacterium]|nr:DUF4832 domain-containing protein [Lachnospiraceae bacterium]
MLFKKKDKSRFEKAIFTEEMGDLSNPGRGWYRLYSFSAGEEIEEEELRWCLNENERLALVMIDLGDFREKCLPKKILLNIERIFAFFQKWEKEMIVRFVYDREGRGMEREPSSLKMIVSHMQQIKALLQTYEKSIFMVQGLFLGSWGEMHTSHYLSKKYLRQLAEMLWEETESDCFFAIRKPVFWRMIFDKEQGERAYKKKVGFFNDGLLASETDLGTYGSEDTRDREWEQMWDRQAEIQFQNEICRFVPNGGEAVGENALGEFSLALKYFYQIHITYLSSVYDERVLERWKKTEYRGMNGYDYIGMHLGYRLVIRNASLNRKKKALEIEIENVGFANLYEETKAYLFFEDEREARVRKAFFVPASYLESRKTTVIQAELPELESGREYRVFFQLRRQKDECLISFANHMEEGRVELGLLLNR